MMISTKGRYALRVMVDLAENGNGEYVTLSDIAERQGISEKYLESIASILSKNEIIDSLRGKGGGYRLNRPPEKYTAAEILRLTEGSLAPVECLKRSENKCVRAAECKTLGMWEKLYALIDEYLDGVTIADLAGERQI